MHELTDTATNSTSPAVAYVRMSTEHQHYSTAHQRDVIRAHAERRGMALIRVYTDEERSERCLTTA